MARWFSESVASASSIFPFSSALSRRSAGRERRRGRIHAGLDLRVALVQLYPLVPSPLARRIQAQVGGDPIRPGEEGRVALNEGRLAVHLTNVSWVMSIASSESLTIPSASWKTRLWYLSTRARKACVSPPCAARTSDLSSGGSRPIVRLPALGHRTRRSSFYS